MIDRQKTNLIEIDGFFHRLHEAETEETIARADTARIDLQIFVRIGNIAFTRCDPMADNARTNHVRDEFKFAAVP